LAEVKEHARLRGQSASALVKEALDAHLTNLRLDIEAEKMKLNAPGGERRELADIHAVQVPWLYALKKGDPYRMGRIDIQLGRSMSKQMTDALMESLQRCIAAAWMGEERRLEHESASGGANGKADGKAARR
jgi:hypothetical protein